MFFEGNEISAVRKLKIKEEDILIFSIDENLDEFDRAAILLKKPQILQVLSAILSLPKLAKLNPVWFNKQIVPIIFQEILFFKDEHLLLETALTIDELLKENLLS